MGKKKTPNQNIHDHDRRFNTPFTFHFNVLLVDNIGKHVYVSVNSILGYIEYTISIT